MQASKSMKEQLQNPGVLQVSKYLVDLSLMVFAVCYLFAEHNEFTGTPRRFEIYQINPNENVKKISNYFKNTLNGKKLCIDPTNTTWPVDCLSYDDLLSGLQNDTGCGGTDNKPPACLSCVDEYAQRVFDYGSETKFDMNLNIATDTKLRKLRDELEACVARTGAGHTVTEYTRTNIYYHFFLWTSLSFCFSTFRLYKLDTEWLKLEMGSFTAYILASFVVSIVHFTINSGDQFSWFDLLVWLAQFLIVMGYFGFNYFFSYGNNTTTNLQKVKKEYQKPVKKLFFAVFTLLASPSIVVIVNMLHGWAEFQMLTGVIVTLLSFFVFSMIDDLALEMWPRNQNDKDYKKFQHIHTSSTAIMFFIIFMLGTTNLPMSPTGDNFNGTLAFTALVIALVAFSVGGFLLQEIKTESDKVYSFKTNVELALRFIIFLLLSNAFLKGM